MRKGIQAGLRNLRERNPAPMHSPNGPHAVGIGLEALPEFRRSHALARIERDALCAGPKGVVHLLDDGLGGAAEFGIQATEERGARILVAIVHDRRIESELRVLRIEVRIDHREDIVEIPVVETLEHHKFRHLLRGERRCHHRLPSRMRLVRQQIGHFRDDIAAEAAPERIPGRIALRARIVTVLCLETRYHRRMIAVIILRPDFSVLQEVINVRQGNGQDTVHQPAIIQTNAFDALNCTDGTDIIDQIVLHLRHSRI